MVKKSNVKVVLTENLLSPMMKILHQEDKKFYLKISSCAVMEQLDELMSFFLFLNASSQLHRYGTASVWASNP